MSTIVFQDTFTEASNTDLVSHTPDIGASWAEFEDTVSAGAIIGVLASTDVCRMTASGAAGERIIYTATPTIALASADYDVEAKFVSISAVTNAFGVLGRVQAGGDYYGMAVVQSTANPDCFLVKRVSGTVTQIGTANTGPANNDVFKLQMRGSTIDVLKNGVSIISVTDTAVTGIGKGGLGFGDFINDATMLPNSNRQLDDFVITDQTSGRVSKNTRSSPLGMEIGMDWRGEL